MSETSVALRAAAPPEGPSGQLGSLTQSRSGAEAPSSPAFGFTTPPPALVQLHKASSRICCLPALIMNWRTARCF